MFYRRKRVHFAGSSALMYKLDTNVDHTQQAHERRFDVENR